jgi:hypothetical protein
LFFWLLIFIHFLDFFSILSLNILFNLIFVSNFGSDSFDSCFLFFSYFFNIVPNSFFFHLVFLLDLILNVLITIYFIFLFFMIGKKKFV